MNDNIEMHYGQQFSANVQLLSQQKGSKLRSVVPIEYVKGESVFVDQVGETAAEPINTRHGDTPVMESEDSRRQLRIGGYEWSRLIDDFDAVKMLCDPTSAYALSAAYAMGRAIDMEIYDAALGTSWTGQKGTEAVVLPSSQKLAADGKGFSFAKLTELKCMFDDADIDTEGRYLVYTASQLKDLLNEEKVTNEQYNAARALEKGEITQFMGFNFINLNGKRKGNKKIISASTVGGKTIRHCLAFSANSLKLGIGEDVRCEISTRPDKRYATQIYYKMFFGATRVEERGVVQFDCVEE